MRAARFGAKRVVRLGLLSAVAGTGLFLLGTAAAHADTVTSPGLLSSVAAGAQSTGSGIGGLVKQVVTLPVSPAAAPAPTTPAAAPAPATPAPVKASPPHTAPAKAAVPPSAKTAAHAPKSPSTANPTPVSSLVNKVISTTTTSILVPATKAVNTVVAQVSGTTHSTPVPTSVVAPVTSVVNDVVGGLSGVVEGAVTSTTSSPSGGLTTIGGVLSGTGVVLPTTPTTPTGPTSGGVDLPLPGLSGIPALPGRPALSLSSAPPAGAPVTHGRAVLAGMPTGAAVLHAGGLASAVNGNGIGGFSSFGPTAEGADRTSAPGAEQTGGVRAGSVSTSTPTMTQMRPTDLPMAPAPSMPGSGTPAATCTSSTTLASGSGSKNGPAAALLTSPWSATGSMAGATTPGSWALPGQVALRPSVSPD